jgi:hypothetical protein
VRLGRRDPGACPICGAAHCACGPTGPITVVQLPARDAALSVTTTRFDVNVPGGLTLGDGSDGRPFSTATYRGTKKR